MSVDGLSCSGWESGGDVYVGVGWPWKQVFQEEAVQQKTHAQGPLSAVHLGHWRGVAVMLEGFSGAPAALLWDAN